MRCLSGVTAILFACMTVLSGPGLLCLPVDCDPPEPDIADEFGAGFGGGCCPQSSPCGETVDDCEETEGSAPPDGPVLIQRSPCTACRCECVPAPPDPALYEGRDVHQPKLVGGGVVFSVSHDEAIVNLHLHRSLPQGVNPIISTTVLRC